MWLNPWAVSPLTCAHPLRVATVDEASERIAITTAATKIHELLGVPEGWPGPEDWPDIA